MESIPLGHTSCCIFCWRAIAALTLFGEDCFLVKSSKRRVHSSPEVIHSVANLVDVRKKEADGGTYCTGSGVGAAFCGGDGLF